jgi:DNA recombination protein RmuC
MINIGTVAVIAIAAAGAAGLAVWLFMKGRGGAQYERGRSDAAVQVATLTEQLRNQEQDLLKTREAVRKAETEFKAQSEALKTEAAARATAEEKASRVSALESEIQKSHAEATALRERNAELLTTIEAERKQTEEKLSLLLQAKEALTDQFRNLANQIFEEKSAKFVQQNQANLDVLLKPLGERLKEFQTKVEETYDKESKQRFSLQSEIAKLVVLNNKISEDAENLTNALKGESKTQGNWGELVLERVLEASGLQKGREYDVQVSISNDEGGRAQPDVIVRLPESKHVIIDSKVSLTAYEEYSAADDDDARAKALTRHIESMRRHVAGLAEKNYQSLYGIRSLDFVLMFMPIEPAFILAFQADRDLFSDAFGKNIMIVGPSTLLISLKTIASIWRYEYQNRNAQELARHCAALYDKFVGFVADLEDIGKKIEAAEKSYTNAFGKLKSGKGNLVRQVERIRHLGVKPGKELPGAMVDAALENSEEEEAVSRLESREQEDQESGPD